MKISDIVKFNEANVQRIIANHNAADAARIIIEKWGTPNNETMIITVERRTEEIISSNPLSVHPSRLEGFQFREAIRFLAKEIDTLHRLRMNANKSK